MEGDTQPIVPSTGRQAFISTDSLFSVNGLTNVPAIPRK
jgi:hypothetical protein